MNVIRKFFSPKLLYYVAIRIKSILQKYIEGVELKENKKKDKDWDLLFTANFFFDHITPDGLTIRLYKDSYLSKLIYDGFETDEQIFLNSVLRKGDYFIDIGANIGIFSLAAAKIIGSSGKVICFEPTPTTFSRLNENIIINQFKNVDARNIGLAEKTGSMELNISENGFDAWNSFTVTDLDKFQNKVLVDVSTLDNELIDIEKSKVRLVKIDVEGWEKYVIMGGANFFKQNSPIVMIEFTESNTFAAGYFVQEIYDQMQVLGYKWYRFQNLKLFPENKNLHYPYDNLIAIKDNLFNTNVNEVINYNHQFK